MDLRNYGIRRRDLREGSGRGSGNDHFEDLIGSTEFYIYQPPDQQPRGYESFKLYLEAQGCEVIFTTDTPVDVGDEYEALRITHRGNEIPVPVLKRAHSWAHQRNLLHSFFKPLYR
jgi:hypothetical protein